MSTNTAAVRRNVVVIGLNDSGKKQIVSQLCQGDNVKPLSGYDSLASDNQQPIGFIMKLGEITYKIMVLDTPGLSRDHNSNKEAINNITELVDHHYENVHLVIFVIDYGRVPEDSRTAIDQFFESTNPKISDVSAIVFSGCSEIVDAQESYEEDFKTQVSWSSKAKLGLYYVDFPNIDNLTEGAKPSAKNQIDTSRKKLEELLGKALQTSSTSLNLGLNLNTERKKHCLCCVCSCK